MLKLFISYSHSDEHYVQDFLKHTVLLEENGLLSERWYDREITAGDDFWDRIDEHLEDRDIVCCFISSHYISSKACKKELEKAIELKETKGVLVVPIILSPCAWPDLPNVKRLLALPTDGKEISSFEDKDKGWLEVYNGLKNAIEKFNRLKNLEFSEQHKEFLEDASLLTKAHGSKNELKMSDIYIHPDVEKRNNDGTQDRMSFEKLTNNFKSGDRIAIVGDDQSGKTTLAKKLVIILKEKGFIPVYIKDVNDLLLGNLKSRIERCFKEQYNTTHDFEDFEIKRIVPIIDDFHKTKHNETIIERSSIFNQLVIIVDTIFDIDLLQEKTVADFERYTILQLRPSLRNELIRKWICVSEATDNDPEFINCDNMHIDERMRAVDRALGKVLGKDIMPAFPFFVLTLLSNYDSLNRPLSEEITSQGYCYQALIILFLGKQGVRDSMDSYINFLTELAYKRYVHKMPLSQEAFQDFFNNYTDEYILKDKRDVFLRRLVTSSILRVSSLGNYDFSYPYLYYFFAGKYFAEHFDERQNDNKEALEELEVILDNLHKNENAYITIFLVHHSKDKQLIDKILLRADKLFKDYSPATMSKEEMSFFKTEKVKQIQIPENANSAEARKQELQRRDEIEANQQNHPEDDDEITDELSLELRRSMKTVEVVGRILFNRSGSFKKDQLAEIFEKGMNVHLRLMASFFELVKRMITYPDYDDFIKDRILELEPELKDKPEALADKSQKVFWNINFGFIWGMVKRISGTLGSRKNMEISDAICSTDMTPVKFLIKEEIAMLHSKNIRIDKIIKYIKGQDMPIVAKNVLFHYVAEFCTYNRIDARDRDQLVSLGMNRKFLMPRTKKDE